MHRTAGSRRELAERGWEVVGDVEEHLMGRIENTVFISYRRTNSYLAKAVYDDLREHGFDVFIDYEGIHSGDFEQAIIENIKGRAHFIVILTPSALKRCNQSGDWLRREIETALEYQRNIIPLMMEGFKFGDRNIDKFLTGKLELLKKRQGLDVPSNLRYFKYAMKELRDHFLGIELDTVLYSMPITAQNVVTEQQTLANQALQITQNELTAQALFEKGSDSDEEGNFEESIRYYTEAIYFNPNFIEAYINRGVARSFNDLDGAFSDYNNIIRLEPGHPEALNNRGLIYQMKGEWENAALDFQKALQGRPKDGNIRSSFMVVLRKLGRNAEADEQEKLARELLQKEEEYERACFEALCGNFDKALKLLKIALNKGQSTKEWLKRDPRFVSIRNDPRFLALMNK